MPAGDSRVARSSTRLALRAIAAEQTYRTALTAEPPEADGLPSTPRMVRLSAPPGSLPWAYHPDSRFGHQWPRRAILRFRLSFSVPVTSPLLSPLNGHLSGKPRHPRPCRVRHSFRV